MARKAMYYYGKVFLSNDTGYYQIVLANNIERMKAIFLTTNTEVWVSAAQVDNGTVFDRYFPTVCGVGYLGEYSTLDKDGNRSKEYTTWHAMLDRCYGNKELEVSNIALFQKSSTMRLISRIGTIIKLVHTGRVST